MERQQILDLYKWAPGICFRHPAEGETATIHVETIRPAGGGLQDVRACVDCALAMEERRKAAAERDGVAYKPGMLGGPDSTDRP